MIKYISTKHINNTTMEVSKYDTYNTPQVDIISIINVNDAIVSVKHINNKNPFKDAYL